MGEKSHLRGYRQAIGAYGYCAQDSPILHFGLPPGKYDVHVRYQTGEEVTLTGIATGQTLEFTGLICSKPLHGSAGRRVERSSLQEVKALPKKKS